MSVSCQNQVIHLSVDLFVCLETKLCDLYFSSSTVSSLAEILIILCSYWQFVLLKKFFYCLFEYCRSISFFDFLNQSQYEVTYKRYLISPFLTIFCKAFFHCGIKTLNLVWKTPLEKIDGKGENADYLHFFFPHIFFFPKKIFFFRINPRIERKLIHSKRRAELHFLLCCIFQCPVKANALARIRQIFTQEIFTEQVITAHAVTVPVTEGLNADMGGYLPIHCIYQLLKSRAFSKYKVPIKVSRNKFFTMNMLFVDIITK